MNNQKFKLFIYFICVISVVSVMSLCLAISGFNILYQNGMLAFMEEFREYILKETPFFSYKIMTPNSSNVTFLLFFYCYQVFYFVNVIPILIYPFLFVYKLLLFPWFDTPLSVPFFSLIYVLMYYYPLIPIVSKFFFLLYKFVAAFYIYLGLFFSKFIEKSTNLDFLTEVYSNGLWPGMLAHDFISLLDIIINSDLISKLSDIIHYPFVIIIIPSEFFFNFVSNNFVLTSCLLYPLGLILIAFSCINLFGFFFDKLGKSQVVGGLNRWYKNLIILKILVIYHSLFFLYFICNILFAGFFNYRSVSTFLIAPTNFMSFDRYALVSIMFICFFLILFIKITINNITKLIDLNTLIMLVVSMFMLVLLVQLSDVFLIYFGIVGLSLSLYPLLSLDKKSHSNLEAVSKYFFLGALASGVMLYGISLIYREVNTLSYSELKNLDFSSLSTTGCTFTLLLGLIFIVFGFLFKLSIVPLQNWTPDVYLGSPTVITCFLATVVKFSIFCSFFRFYYGVVVNFFMDNLEFKNLLICFSVASILIGAFGAVDQFKIKRFLGFTTINQMGFIFLGVSLQNLYGFVASYVYLCIYICLNLILFFFILNIKTNDGKDLTYLSDLVPFFKANKLTGMFFVLLLFSLAGMPPTIGFYMKLLILKSLVISGHIKLTLVILYVNVFSILYYVRIIKILFFDAESILFSDRTEFSKKTSFFEVFKTPFSEVKNIEEIVQNRTLYTKFIVFCFRQLLCYALVLFFLSGIWYIWLIDNPSTSSIIAYMWSDLNMLDHSSLSDSGLHSSVYNFLRII